MNVYCVKCGSEMEIMRDLGSELRVYPCGCGGKGKQKRQPTKDAQDGAIVCPECDGAVEFCAMGHYVPAKSAPPVI